MGLTSIAMGILASEGKDSAVDKAKSTAGDAIKKLHDERELRKKVDSIVNEYCQGIQETLDLEQEFDVEGLKTGSKDLINSAKECSVGPEREVKQIQYFAKGYSLAGVDPKKRNRSLDAVLVSVLNVVLEESGQAVTIKAVDEIHEHLAKLATRIDKLATREDIIEIIKEYLGTFSANEPVEQNSEDFTLYYDYVKKRFTRKQDKEYAKLVGTYSDDEAYIDAFINTHKGGVPVLSFLKEWFDQDTYGTLLIHGEPGHGKSMLCNKAMFEHYKGTFLPEAKNVLSFTLNTGINDKIIKDETFNIEAILSWNGHQYTFEDCRESLLFLDGFDEFIDAAQKTNITDIFSFMRKIEAKADEYDIHIVVLSRTIAISEALEEGSAIKYKSYELMPITEEQQDNWLDEHSEYNDYKETLNNLRNNKDMDKLLGIPFLFRMIVHARYGGVSKNTVQLYDNLINHLMKKRDIRGNDLKQVIAELCELSHDIYCNDTDTAIIDGDKRNDRWMIVFYIKQEKHGIYGFFHRSFYQYFLAKYAYLHILDIKSDKQAEDLISAFAERELDDTVLYFLTMMIDENDTEKINKNLKLVIEALVRTEAYLNLEPRNQDGTAEKTKLGRTINVYRNTLHICTALFYIIEKPFCDGLDVFIRTYPSYALLIWSDEKNRANLSGINLTRADLRVTNLSGSNLSGSNLRLADLTDADLSGANLHRTDLGRADLRAAKLDGADLSGANLRETNLLKAILSRANLRSAILCKTVLRLADLSEAKLIGADARLADLSLAKLNGANLSGADLRRANLSGTDLSGGDLSGADLGGADLGEANLSESNLSGANLSGADLRVKCIDHAIIDSDKKELFDTSIEGYETVVWI